jgi:hypothetical protein
MQKLVEENSQPEFADEEVASINEFKKNGGKLQDYLKSNIIGNVDIELIDLTEPSEQKLLIRENLRNKGTSDIKIEKMIKRWEDAGTLDEEAEDALEEVKEYRDVSKRKLLEEQKIYSQQIKQQQQKFVQDVDDTIKNIKDIRGIQISDKEKKDLYEYIFKPDADGITQYQRDYSKNVKNLIESAYFTKMGDSLVKKIERKAESQAAKNLKEKLSNNKGDKFKNQGQGNNGSSSVFGLLGSQFIKKP